MVMSKLKKMLLIILGIPTEQPKDFNATAKIKCEMITPDVVRVDIKSLKDFLATEEGKQKSGFYFKKGE